jgi:hypothetical protein
MILIIFEINCNHFIRSVDFFASSRLAALLCVLVEKSASRITSAANAVWWCGQPPSRRKAGHARLDTPSRRKANDTQPSNSRVDARPRTGATTSQQTQRTDDENTPTD